jgi:hypothetical protein
MEISEIPPSPLFIVITLELESLPTQDTAPDPLFISIDLEDDVLPSPQVADISLRQEALGLLPAPHPARSSSLNLANVLDT